MKVLILLGNQRPGSFCHAIAQTAIDELRIAGHAIFFHDLYAENWDPVLPDCEIPKDSPKHSIVQQHCDELLAADGIVVIHPNWWSMPPAILKGWLDRVLCQGVAYDFSEGGQIIGHLRGKTVVVLTTSNTPRDMELELYGDPLQKLWETCVFGFCGVERFYRRNFESIILSSLEERVEWLANVKSIIREQFPASPGSCDR
ncbi:MAG: NAD(P)H-dependent oxidoreductase [Pirellulales bacterium]|nr:NAD(P)H-dependent oxidoreductase [Pirellulales bacterium]